jgi:exopolyphosphatase/guanosine-5'-triphosphate,3'-diphosphate pyrophosphatase
VRSAREPGSVRSVIDLGTNTVLMVTGRLRPDGSVEVLDDAHGIARLGQGVDARRRIDAETANRVCGFLQRYRERAASLGSLEVTAYGTSALRDAVNRGEFISQVEREVGIRLIAISGEEEARLTFIGAGFGLDLPSRYGVLDIGGGSTELAVGTVERLEASGSVDAGAVRLTERHFPSLPPTSAQIAAAIHAVDSRLAGLPSCPSDVPLVGVAGTVTTLGALDRGMTRFDAEELNGHRLTADRVEDWSARLLALSLAQARAFPAVDEDRADIIAAGSLILRRALRLLGRDGLLVSTRGIRYGLLLAALGAGPGLTLPEPD